jgi:chemotaxis response regulator CheB
MEKRRRLAARSGGLRESLADAYGSAALGVMLTRSNHDGADGVAAIERALTLDQIALEIRARCRSGQHARQPKI